MEKIPKKVFLKAIKNYRLKSLESQGVFSKGPGDLRFAKKVDRPMEKLQGVYFQINGETYAKNQVFELICQEVSNGKGLKEIVRLPGFPTSRQVAAWLREEPVFRQAYEAAEEVRAIFLAEEVLEHADEAEGKDGRNDPAAVKLRVESRKWMAGKLNKKFSDRQVIEHHHELDLKSEDELRAMLVAGIEADPRILKMIDQKTLSTILGRATDEQSSLSQTGVQFDSNIEPNQEEPDIALPDPDED